MNVHELNSRLPHMPVGVRLLALFVAGLVLVGAAFLNGWTATNCAEAGQACARASGKASRIDALSSSNCFVQETVSLGKRPVSLATSAHPLALPPIRSPLVFLYFCACVRVRARACSNDHVFEQSSDRAIE